MNKIFPRRRAFSIWVTVAAVLLVFGLGGFGLALAARQAAQTPAGPTTAAAISELARRFHVPDGKQTMLQLSFAFSGGDDMRQSLRDTLTVLQQSNAADDLTAPPVATGDALFDRYAQAIDMQLNAPNASRKKSNTFSRAALGDAQLARWEGDFGQDPRYWELRYLCAIGAGPQAPLAAGFTKPSDFLDEAQKRGIATANTLLVRYKEQRDAHEAELKPFAPPAQPQQPSPTGTVPGPAKAGSGSAIYNAPPVSQDPQAVAITKRQRVEQLALLDAAVNAGPGEAWPRYLRALYWFEQGEQAKGLDDLAAGNAAKVLDLPQPWPLNSVEESPGQTGPAGSAAVCGDIYVLNLKYSQPPAVKFKRALRENLARIEPGDDLAPLEAWHQFSCRYAQGEPINFLTTTVMDSIICSYVEENLLGSLTPAQLETLQRCRGARDAFRGAWRDAPIYDSISASIALIPFGDFRAVDVAMYMEQCSDWQRFQGGDAARIIADLSQVRFPELVLPECMKKYEAVSLEEAQRRGAERRAKNQQAREAKAAKDKSIK